MWSTSASTSQGKKKKVNIQPRPKDEVGSPSLVCVRSKWSFFPQPYSQRPPFPSRRVQPSSRGKSLHRFPPLSPCWSSIWVPFGKRHPARRVGCPIRKYLRKFGFAPHRLSFEVGTRNGEHSKTLGCCLALHLVLALVNLIVTTSNREFSRLGPYGPQLESKPIRGVCHNRGISCSLECITEPSSLAGTSFGIQTPGG